MSYDEKAVNQVRVEWARRCTTARRAGTGFTLIELAVTLAIVAVLAGAVLVPFVAQIAQRNRVATDKTLEQVKEALLGFATATGRFPCPALEAPPPPYPTGVEVFAVTGNISNGECASFVGLLPAVTLGFTPVDAQGFAIDGWGTAQNRIRYAVSSQTIGPPTAYIFTSVNGMRKATAAQIATTPLLHVCKSSAGVVANTNCGAAAGNVLTENAPVVIWSLGANAAAGGAGADELENANGDRIFVSRTAQSAAGNEFDDIVTWISIGYVISRMVVGGQLP